MSHRNPYYRRGEIHAEDRRRYEEELRSRKEYLDLIHELNNWSYYLQHYHAVNENPKIIFNRLKGGLEKKQNG